MILTDEAATVLVLLIVGAGLVALIVMGFGAFLMRRGYRLLGLSIIAVVVGGLAGPGMLDRARNAPFYGELDARNTIPDTLDLTGQRVLFIETGSTICGEICGDVVRLGTDVEAYWMGMGGFIPESFSDNPLGDVLDGAEHVRLIQLAPPDANDPIGQRFAEPAGAGHTPPYDVVIVYDDSALVQYIAPDLIGGALPDTINVQWATLVFTDWPDPFAGPPPPPTYRSVGAHFPQRPLLPIPFVGSNSVSYPSFTETTAAWMRALCPFAGDAPTRDPFTYGYRCDADALSALWDE